MAVKTTKVRLIAGLTGTRDGIPWPPAGTVVVVTEDEAEGLFATGSAEKYSEKKHGKDSKDNPHIDLVKAGAEFRAAKAKRNEVMQKAQA